MGDPKLNLFDRCPWCDFKRCVCGDYDGAQFQPAERDSDRYPEGEDPKGLSAEHESAVAKPIAQDLSVSGNP
jgi:hypothetical protein